MPTGPVQGGNLAIAFGEGGLGCDRHMKVPILIGIAVTMFAGCQQTPDVRRTNFRVDKPGISVQYDDKTGHLKKIEIDQNKNGRMDTWSYWDATRLDRIEIDKDEDGKIERWEHFGPKSNTQVISVGSSSKDDGVEDTWTYPEAENSPVTGRVETDTDRDGHVDRREIYAASSKSPGARVISIVELDLDKAGQPSKRLYYNPDGSFDRMETLRP